MYNLTRNRIEVVLERSSMYKVLAVLIDSPTDSLMNIIKSGIIGEVMSQSLMLLAEYAPSYERAVSMLEELRAVLRDEVASLSVQDIRDEHTRVFTRLYNLKCPPYETEYGYGNIFQKTNAMADIAGFYRAFGVDLSPDSKERVDCITMELEFMHVLTAKEAEALKTSNADGAEVCSSAQMKFLEEHLGRWTSAFVAILKEQVPSGLYPAIAAFIDVFIACEMNLFALNPEPVDATLRCDEAETRCQLSCMIK